MKNLTSISLLFVFILFSLSSKVYAETYLGDFCWQVFKGEDPEWTYRFGVYQKDGGHYALFGREDDGFGGITAVHGSAAIVGDEVKLNIMSAGFSNVFGAWSESLSAILSITTLSGTWNALGSIGAGSGAPNPYHTDGTIVLIACS